MTNTLKEISDYVYFVLGEEETSTIFNKEKIIIPSINRVRNKICRWEVKNILQNRTLRCWDVAFLHRDFLFKEDWNTYPIKSVDYNTKTVELNTEEGKTIETISNEKWAMIIDWILVEYESFTWNSFVWCEGLKEIHYDKTVKIAHKIDIDVSKPVDVFNVENNEKLEEFKPNEKIIHNNSYTIYRDNQWKDRYLVIHWFKGIIRVGCQIKFANMIKPTDECWLPDDYWIEAIANIVAGEVLVKTSEVNKWQMILNEWYSAVAELFSTNNNERKANRRRIKATPMHTEDLI